MEIRAGVEVDIVGVQMVCLDSLVFFEHGNVIVDLVSKRSVEVEHVYSIVILIINILVLKAI